MIETTPDAYEIRCARCDVSFPPEARVCLHCGNRLGGLVLGRPRRGRPTASADAAQPGTGPGPIDGEVDEGDLEQRSGGLLRTGLGSAWVLLALTATCYRVCAGG